MKNLNYLMLLIPITGIIYSIYVHNESYAHYYGLLFWIFMILIKLEKINDKLSNK